MHRKQTLESSDIIEQTAEAQKEGDGERIAEGSIPTLEERANASQLQVCATGDPLTLTGPAWSLRWAILEVLFGERPDLPRGIWVIGWVIWEAGRLSRQSIVGSRPFV